MNTKSCKLLGALIGLARASEGNSDLLLPQTERVIIEGLHTIYIGNEKAFPEMEKKARDEKYRIVPDCANCAHPCGRTFDYDFSLMHNEEDNVRAIKNLLIPAVISTGEKAYRLLQQGIETDDTFFYKGLYAIGGIDWTVDYIMPVFFECGENAMRFLSKDKEKEKEYNEILSVIRGNSSKEIIIDCTDCDSVCLFAITMCFGIKNVIIKNAEVFTPALKQYFSDNYNTIF